MSSMITSGETEARPCLLRGPSSTTAAVAFKKMMVSRVGCFLEFFFCT